MAIKIQDYDCRDTICAIATPSGTAALGVIKISGSEAIKAAAAIFRPKRKKDITKAKTYTLHYGWIVEKRIKHAKERIVDEVLLSVMRRPRSYTGEDVIEISCHGGLLVLNKILDLLLGLGLRLALPGEFTYRALIFGRINIFQAQGVNDIINARTPDGLRLAVSQLNDGNLSVLSDIKESLKNLLVRIEAFINFPEDQIQFCRSDFSRALGGLRLGLERIIAASCRARILREGARCVIAGRANAGKSTLFNCLLKKERVITSRLPGTTRDVVEETVLIDGLALRIYDTAGILEAKDLVAKKALEKTRLAFDAADVIILVLDRSRKMSRHDKILLRKVRGRNAIIVINKSDLPARLKAQDIPGRKVKLSALQGKGVKQLEKAIARCVSKCAAAGRDMIFLNQYQIQIMCRMRDKLDAACGSLRSGRHVDFVAASLAECLDCLGRLSGEVSSQELLNSIFNDFCIGK